MVKTSPLRKVQKKIVKREKGRPRFGRLDSLLRRIPAAQGEPLGGKEDREKQKANGSHHESRCPKPHKWEKAHGELEAEAGDNFWDGGENSEKKRGKGLGHSEMQGSRAEQLAGAA